MSTEKDAKQVSLLDKLENLDARIVSWMLILVLLAVNMYPMGLPLPVGSETQRFYNIIESLPPGSVVVFGTDTAINALGEQIIALEPIYAHLMKKPIKVVMCTFVEPAAGQIPDMLVKKLGTGGKTYGVDYVNLGYAAGREAAVTKFAQDIHEVFKNDFYGTPIGKIPMMEKIRSYKDVSLIVEVSDSYVNDLYLRYVVMPYGTPMVVAAAAMIYVQLLPYLSSGQYKSLITSQRGGAEYERLVGYAGSGRKIMDSQSAGHLLVVVLMVMGNCIFLYKKYGKAN